MPSAAAPCGGGAGIAAKPWRRPAGRRRRQSRRRRPAPWRARCAWHPRSSLNSSQPQNRPTRLFIFHSGNAIDEPHVADGENGERVGHGPQHAGENGPHHEVRLLAQIGPDVAGAFQRHRHRPAGHEHARHHAERNQERRQAGGDQLGGRFGRRPATRPRPVRRPRRGRAGSGRMFWRWWGWSFEQRQQNHAENQAADGRPQLRVGQNRPR